MSQIKIIRPSEADKTMKMLYGDLSRRLEGSPTGNCPVEMTSAFLKLCLAQSCGKCVPCRIGLDKLAAILDRVLEGEGTMEDLKLIETTAQAISDSADCAIGFEGAKLVLDGFRAFRDDYEAHVKSGMCTANFHDIPCMAACPAHVDIPGYIGNVQAGNYADAIRTIRKDNPFPSVCGLVCEHPCERDCRRNLVDDAVNIRGLKRVAVEKAGKVDTPAAQAATGKKVALVIFSVWKPLNAIWGSYLFAALFWLYMYADKLLGVVLDTKGSEALEMLPYVITIVVLIVISFRKKKELQPPASLGLSYFREER